MRYIRKFNQYKENGKLQSIMSNNTEINLNRTDANISKLTDRSGTGPDKKIDHAPNIYTVSQANTPRKLKTIDIEDTIEELGIEIGPSTTTVKPQLTKRNQSDSLEIKKLQELILDMNDRN